MHLAQLDSSSPEMRSQTRLVKRVDSKAEMIHVSGRFVWRCSTLARRNGHQIDERLPCTEVIQPQVLAGLFETAAQYFAVKIQHPLHVDAANDDVIDSDDLHIRDTAICRARSDRGTRTRVPCSRASKRSSV